MSVCKKNKTKELNAGPAASKTYVEIHVSETRKANVQNMVQLDLKASEG